MDNSTAPFEIGDRVVAIEDKISSMKTNSFKKGDEFTILGVIQCHKCETWLVDIGFTTSFSSGHQPCMSIFPGNVVYSNHRYFRKINPYSNSITEQLAKEALESIGDGQDMKPVKKEVTEDV